MVTNPQAETLKVTVLDCLAGRPFAVHPPQGTGARVEERIAVFDRWKCFLEVSRTEYFRTQGVSSQEGVGASGFTGRGPSSAESVNILTIAFRSCRYIGVGGAGSTVHFFTHTLLGKFHSLHVGYARATCGPVTISSPFEWTIDKKGCPAANKGGDLGRCQVHPLRDSGDLGIVWAQDTWAGGGGQTVRPHTNTI